MQQDKTPSGGLKWVKRDLLAGLERVRTDVAAGADLGDVVTTLFEVRGILLALPLPAAAALAEEMQRAAEALSAAGAPGPAGVREALGLALAQLPAYLARVDAGAGEEPLALLPPINDLRRARGLPAMTAAELLLPASVLAQTEHLSAEALERLARIARKVRPHFHRYLVRWFGDHTSDVGLLGLSRLFNQMRRYFKDGPVQELFLAAEGVIEGLLTGTIVGDAPCKALIGRIDRVLKPLTALDNPQWPEEVASVLLSDLLAQLAQVPPGSPVVQELERAYGRRLTAEPAAGVGGADGALLLDALRQDLAPIAALLAPPVIGGAETLGSAAARLERLGASFALLGQEALGARLTRAAAALAQIAGAPRPDAGRLADIAQLLGHVDSELRAVGELTALAPATPRAGDTGVATLRRARGELAAVRAGFGADPLAPRDLDRLEQLAAVLGDVAEALGGAGEIEPARVLLALREQIEQRYLQPRLVPGDAGIDLIARALSAVDIHLEDRIERDQVDPRMLGEAGYAIERLTALLRADQLTDVESESSESLPMSEVSHSVNLEFLALFLDEAEEEVEAIRAAYQRWSDDHRDDAALVALLRSFQALKGSGGLVGAQHLADLARLAAALLDRALDGASADDAAVGAFLGEVVAALPAAVQAEAERRRPALGDLLSRGRALLSLVATPPPGRADDGPPAAARHAATGAATGAAPDAATGAPAGAGGGAPFVVDDGSGLHPFMPAPGREDFTEEPLSVISPSEDFSFAPGGVESSWRAPPADGLVVETVELDTSGGSAYPASGPAADGGDAGAGDVAEEVAFLDEADLSQVFAAEARDLIAGLDAWLRDGGEEALTPGGAAAALRRLHTLKGSARMAGVAPIGDLSHALESLLQARPLAPDAAASLPPQLIQRAVDLLAEQVEAVAAERPIPVAGALMAELDRAVAVVRLPGGAAPPAGAPLAGAPLAGAPLAGAPLAGAAPSPTAGASARADAADGTAAAGVARSALALRLAPEWLDQLINLAGEVGTHRARLVQQNTRLGFRRAQLDEALRRLGRRVQRVAGDVGGAAGADPRASERVDAYLLQARDLLGESVRVLDSIGELQRDNVDLLAAQARITANLQDRLLETRMVAFAEVEARLQRLVRQAAASVGKDVALTVFGGQVELDRTVLDRLLGPLSHLLRNAVAHGIEPAELRAARGKAARGSVSISCEREGNDILLHVADDGAGMDPAHIRAHAEACGLIAPGADLSDDAILDLTLQPGFSTAETLTQLAGRGVGLDVVKAEIAALNGEVRLASRVGLGLNVSIRLPLTLSIVDALLVTAGGNLLALPHGGLLAVARVERARLVGAGPGEAVLLDYQGEPFRVLSLAAALHGAHAGDPAAPARQRSPLPRRRWLPVVLVRSGGQRVAFQVDALGGSQRVMVKPVGPPLGSLRWLSGGTLLPDGRVALIVDLLALIRSGAAFGAPTPQPPQRVLLIDDSDLARRSGRALLARPATKVLTALDTSEVEAVLRRETPDLLLLDAEPGRVNGLDLVQRLRAEPQLRQLPILMVAEAADDALRRRAFAVGVDRLLVKPFDDAVLRAEVDAVLAYAGL